MTPTETNQIVRLLAAAYPMARIDEDTIAAYHLGLEDLLFADVRKAIGQLVREKKFMPTIAEIRTRLLGPAPKHASELEGDERLAFEEHQRLARGTIEALGYQRARELIGQQRLDYLLGAGVAALELAHPELES